MRAHVAKSSMTPGSVVAMCPSDPPLVLDPRSHDDRTAPAARASSALCGSKRERRPMTDDERNQRNLRARERRAAARVGTVSVSVGVVAAQPSISFVLASPVLPTPRAVAAPPPRAHLFANDVIAALNFGSSSAIPLRVAAVPRTDPPARQSVVLEESDSDEEVVRRVVRPRTSASAPTEEILNILGAHAATDAPWPESTSVSCWNCTYGFDGIPVPLPGKYDRATGKMKGCTGVFCSFNCAKRYAIGTSAQNANWMLQSSLLSLLHKRIVGKTVQIRPALPAIVLERYGGVVTIEEYRRGFQTLSTEEGTEDDAVEAPAMEMLGANCVPAFLRVQRVPANARRWVGASTGGARDVVEPRLPTSFDRSVVGGTTPLARCMGITAR